jgi:hypothetical protein
MLPYSELFSVQYHRHCFAIVVVVVCFDPLGYYVSVFLIYLIALLYM